MVNWYFGWCSILAAFVSGAVIGVSFHRAEFLGGYGSFRRRLVRLGHIALAALGMLNVLYGLAPTSVGQSPYAGVASVGFILGGAAMTAVCWLTAWREGFRHLFFVPVVALIVAAGATILGGPP